MTPPVTERPRARLDLLEQFVYLGQQAGHELAERYLTAVEETCLQLATHPRSGKRYDSGIARFDGMRWFPVKDFEKYFIFYLPGARSIDVIRILHSARDIEGIFGTEAPTGDAT